MRKCLRQLKIERHAGFTLIEVMIAVVVLSVAILATGSTVIAVVNANSFNRCMAAAITLAQDKLEDLKNLAYTDSALVTGQDPNPLTPTGGEGGSYTRTWTVTPESPSVGMSTIVVTVQWISGGTNHSVSLKTIRVP